MDAAARAVGRGAAAVARAVRRTKLPWTSRDVGGTHFAGAGGPVLACFWLVLACFWPIFAHWGVWWLIWTCAIGLCSPHWARGTQTELVHKHSGKRVLRIRIKCTKSSIGREQGCGGGGPVWRVSPSAISAEREDTVPWVMLLTVRCQHRHGERVRACPTRGHNHGRWRWIFRHGAARADRRPCSDELR